MPVGGVFLVTGGGGFLASRLIPFLCREIGQAKIIVIRRTKRKGPWRKGLRIHSLYGDLRDGGLWKSLPKTITHVFHLAAVIPWKDDEQNRALIAADNLVPLARLIEHSQAWPNLKQVIYSSSISVYAETSRLLNEDSLKRPAGIYSASKLAGEQLLLCLKSRGIGLVSLRYSSLYGYGQYQGTILPIMVNRAIKRQDIFIYGDGSRTQDFLEGDDAAYANLLACQKQAQGVFNIGSGRPVTMIELAKMISRIFSKGKSKIICLPEKVDARPSYKINISKAKSELNYKPMFQLDSGLSKLKKDMQKAQLI